MGKTFALMFGCPVPELPEGKTWWGGDYDGEGKSVPGIVDLYTAGVAGMKPREDKSGDVLGFFVAVGGNGASGCPRLRGPLDLANVESTYAGQLAAVRAAWPGFAEHCAEHGVKLPEARTWLVETVVG